MTVYVLFGVYALVMFYLLFFQRMGRSSGIAYHEYITSAVNLIPFRTIINYISDFQKYSSLSSFSFVNLSGNIVLFIPLGIFLPTIWKKQRKFSKFVITVCITIIAVELIQLFTMLGSCDIDDLIFNVLGAVIGFGIWKLKPVVKLLHRYGFL